MQTKVSCYSKSSTIILAHNLEVVSEQHGHKLCNFSSEILKYRLVVISHGMEKYETLQSINNHTDIFIPTTRFFKPSNLKTINWVHCNKQFYRHFIFLNKYSNNG